MAAQRRAASVPVPDLAALAGATGEARPRAANLPTFLPDITTGEVLAESGSGRFRMQALQQLGFSEGFSEIQLTESSNHNAA